ncbi:MAG: hypothetical protein LBJ31_06030 [Treponema sp.]|nr:hypothetical protein [Treponema sp.]
MTKQKVTNKKRLDGKKKLVCLTSRMEADLKQYCRERGIESESELIRQAIVKYLDSSYDDNSLKFSALKDIRETVETLRDMIRVLYGYQRMMHINLLAYQGEIAEEYKAAAQSSATARHEKFEAGFRRSLRNDPPFFEKLLHGYVTGELDG